MSRELPIVPTILVALAVATMIGLGIWQLERKQQKEALLASYAAAAGKPRPTIIMGNRQDELQWWKKQKEKDGYQTWSASIAPGVSTLAFWVAQQVLDGRADVPHDLLVPYLAFTQDDFEAALPKIEVGGVASAEYTQEDAIKAIEANIKK